MEKVYFSEAPKNHLATGQRRIKLPSGSTRTGWITGLIASDKSGSALKKIRLLLIPHGDRTKQQQRATVPKTTIDRPSIIKKEHATTY